VSLDSIRRRREERLRKLREEMRQKTIEFDDDEYEPSYFEPRHREQSSSSYIKNKSDLWEEDNDYWSEKEQSHESEGSSFMLKMVVSLFLVSFTYITYHADLPFSHQGKEFIGQVMSRDFNFKGAVAEIENRFGINTAILPTLSTQSSQTVWSPGNNKMEFSSPIKGEVTTPFGSDGKGIQIASQEPEVKAIEEGWVIFVGNKESFGKTVDIVHKNGTKSSYSGLQDILVSEGDWVQPGHLIARMSPGSSLYFSMQMKDEYVDPMSVITFE